MNITAKVASSTNVNLAATSVGMTIDSTSIGFGEIVFLGAQGNANEIGPYQMGFDGILRPALPSVDGTTTVEIADGSNRGTIWQFSKDGWTDTMPGIVSLIADNTDALIVPTMLPEKIKAAMVPVAGALVISPLSATLKNYGSLGGSMTLVGAPVQIEQGLCTDGVSSAAKITTGNSADFTCTFSARLLAASVNFLYVMSADLGVAGWKGWCLSADTTHFSLTPAGLAAVTTSVAVDNVHHVFSMVRSSGTTTLYIDGTVAATTTAGVTGGTILLIGVGVNTVAAYQYWAPGCVRNIALYASALTDEQRQQLEQWAASDIDDRITVTPSPKNPIITHGASAWYANQVEEPVLIPDPNDPSQIVMFYSGVDATGGVVGIGRATASVTSDLGDPASWTHYASNPIYSSGRRLDSIQLVNGVYHFYLSGVANSVDLFTSVDGYTLTAYASNPVLAPSGDETTVQQAAVLHDDDGTWRMWYSYRTASAILPGIRYATSSDGKSWTKIGGTLISTTGGTPWATYFEWHQIIKLRGRYILTCEVYDGRYWTICLFWSRSPGSGWIPASKNIAYDDIAGGHHIATGAFYHANGRWYLIYQFAPSAANYISQRWDMGVATAANPLAFLEHS